MEGQRYDLVRVIGVLVIERAKIEQGDAINAMEIIGNMTVQNMAQRQRQAEIFSAIKTMNNLRNEKQTELAKLNNTSAPEPVVIDDAEMNIGTTKMEAHLKALAESLKAMDELLAAHKVAVDPATDAPIKDTEPEVAKSDPPPVIEDGQVYDGRG